MDYSEKYAQALKSYASSYTGGDGAQFLITLQSIERRGLHKPTAKEKLTLEDLHRFGLKPTVQ